MTNFLLKKHNNAKFVVVSVNLKNIGDEDITFSEGSFVIKYKGKHYSMKKTICLCMIMCLLEKFFETLLTLELLLIESLYLKC